VTAANAQLEAARDPGACAARQIAAVSDDLPARLALSRDIYEMPTASSRRYTRYRRAAMSFMRWEAARGVLNPLNAKVPGSPWWRAMNDRLLRDGCEAVARSRLACPEDASWTVQLWEHFLAKPSAGSWYRAHNSSIVAAYLDGRSLAEREGLVERFFLNVVLLRVLYAHALVSAPRLALGPSAAVGRLLGDPRLGMAGAFLSLSRVLPARYPLAGDLERYLDQEQRLGRMLDYIVIVPRLQPLYEWSARELGQPALLDLIEDGSPTYAWPHADRGVWDAPTSRPAVLTRALSLATGLDRAASGRRFSETRRVIRRR
jgi:hypothetical protein